MAWRDKIPARDTAPIKSIAPVIFSQKYYRGIEKRINEVWWKIFYEPILAILRDDDRGELSNAPDDVIAAAIRSGRVEYHQGVISGRYSGKLSAALKKAGAVYDGRSKTWRIDSPPASVQIAAAEASSKASRMQRRIAKALDDIDAIDILDEADLMSDYERETVRMTGDVNRTIQAVAIPPELSAAAAKAIARDWSRNLELYIQEWTAANIYDLREKVEANALRGQRAENLVKLIQDNYSTSRAKARFLARQETSLLMSKIKQQQYAGVGIKKYVWSGADDERERPDHRALNGKVFSFSDPPITDQRTGARNNPGEDYGCRCVAKPILPA